MTSHAITDDDKQAKKSVQCVNKYSVQVDIHGLCMFNLYSLGTYNTDLGLDFSICSIATYLL